MKTLIAYYSFTGNNAVLAAELKDRLNADLYEIKEKKQRTAFTILFDILFNRTTKIQEPPIKADRYDSIILLGPVWNAKIATPLKSFIQLQEGKLSQYVLVTVCGGRPGQQEKIEQQLTKLAGQPPLLVTQLALNDLLPPERKRNTKNGTSYKIGKPDLKYFDPALTQLVGKLALV